MRSSIAMLSFVSFQRQKELVFDPEEVGPEGKRQPQTTIYRFVRSQFFPPLRRARHKSCVKHLNIGLGPIGRHYRLGVCGYTNFSTRTRTRPAGIPVPVDLLLPPQSTASQHYHLRRRTHDRQLRTQTSHLCNKNFVTRALYKGCY